ncbi:UPF0488 protein C8orf33 homolog isoform X1 [Montipora foliosa]|uniref:UPF0488 protein C8orf33 homolog isoform X1 n=1 Tax=Montipora foliosa TaxID=591990 RepID=UPI0035F1EC01
MADRGGTENEKELTAKQRKNRRKREAAKRNKQEQKESAEMVTETKLENIDGTKSPETSEKKFHCELNWCIEQLEMSLSFKKPDKKQAEVVHRHLRSLKSPKTPLPRKRQLMFTLFGDYRKKMQEDQKKQRQDAIKLKPKLTLIKNEDQKSIFVKVCQTKSEDLDAQKDKDAALETNHWQFCKSDNNFRFDFANNADQTSS